MKAHPLIKKNIYGDDMTNAEFARAAQNFPYFITDFIYEIRIISFCSENISNCPQTYLHNHYPLPRIMKLPVVKYSPVGAVLDT